MIFEDTPFTMVVRRRSDATYSFLTRVRQSTEVTDVTLCDYVGRNSCLYPTSAHVQYSTEGENSRLAIHAMRRLSERIDCNDDEGREEDGLLP